MAIGAESAAETTVESAGRLLSGPLGALPPELARLLEGPSIMFLGTRDAALQPMSTIAFGLRLAPRDGHESGVSGADKADHRGDSRDRKGREVTVFLPSPLAPMMLANLRDNGQMALTIVRPTDHQSVQVKGIWLGERRTDDDDRAYVERYREGLTQELGLVGVPRSIWRRVIWWPSLALRMEVREVFVQTPGPGAGRRCEPGATTAP